MSKTTKEHRVTYRSLFAESQSPLAVFVKQMIDGIEAAEAEIEKLNKMLKYEVQDSCDAESAVKAEAKKVLPANLVDGDDCCVPDVTEIVAMLVAEVERLRKQSLFRPISELPVLVATLPQSPQAQESENILLSKEDYEHFVAECLKPGKEPSEKLKKLADDYKRTVTSLPEEESESGK